MVETLILVDKLGDPIANFSIATLIQLYFLVDPIGSLLELQILLFSLNFRKKQVDESWQFIDAQLMTQFIVVRQFLLETVQKLLLMGNFEQVAQRQRISSGFLLAFLSTKGACLGVSVA